MKIENISHVAIAVRDLEAQIAIYRDVLGLELVSLEQVDDQVRPGVSGVRVVVEVLRHQQSEYQAGWSRGVGQSMAWLWQ